ncbi:MAG: glycosyltransferase family 2 protein [Candidatus Omnitrophota bacterium]
MNEETPITVVIAAYNEEAAIGQVVGGLKAALRDAEHEILVVDDGSSDATAEKAAAAGAQVIRHRVNRGYGASLKTGIRKAKYDLILTFDGDGQHDPNDALRLLQALKQGCDIAIGVRDGRSFQYASRMPGKSLLQGFAGFLAGVKPADVNSGLRLFRKVDVMNYFPLLPNGFSFSTTLTLAMLKDAYELSEIPIQTHPRQGRRSTVNLGDGLRTAMLIVRIAALFNPLKVFTPISLLLFLLGFAYAALNILLREWNVPSGAELLMIAGVIVFFFGVLADQLASLRRINKDE